MRIANLANRMDIFRRKPVGCGFPRTRGQAYNGGNIAAVGLKSKKNLRVTSPQVRKPGLYSGVASDSDPSACIAHKRLPPSRCAAGVVA